MPQTLAPAMTTSTRRTPNVTRPQPRRHARAAHPGERWVRLRTPRLVQLADSMPPFGTPDTEAGWAAHMELLERLEIRSSLTQAELL